MLWIRVDKSWCLSSVSENDDTFRKTKCMLRGGFGWDEFGLKNVCLLVLDGELELRIW